MPSKGSQAAGAGGAAGEDRTGVEAYIASAPAAVQPKLRELRAIITSAAPSATEKLSYGMPFYDYFGRLVYFGGYKTHVGVYGLAHVEGDVSEQLKPYLDHRSTLRFSPDGALPVAALQAAIRRRMKENESGHREGPRRAGASR